MVEYPKQIFCVWGNNVSMDAAFNLCTPFEQMVRRRWSCMKARCPDLH